MPLIGGFIMTPDVNTVDPLTDFQNEMYGNLLSGGFFFFWGGSEEIESLQPT